VTISAFCGHAPLLTVGSSSLMENIRCHTSSTNYHPSNHQVSNIKRLTTITTTIVNKIMYKMVIISFDKCICPICDIKYSRTKKKILITPIHAPLSSYRCLSLLDIYQSCYNLIVFQLTANYFLNRHFWPHTSTNTITHICYVYAGGLWYCYTIGLYMMT
jgi:hypothetical protein